MCVWGGSFPLCSLERRRKFPYQVCALKNPTAASALSWGESGEKDERLLLKVTLGLGFLPLPLRRPPVPPRLSAPTLFLPLLPASAVSERGRGAK